jgi:hypothetical protein
MAKRHSTRTPAPRVISYPDPAADPAMRALELAVLAGALTPAQPGKRRHPEVDRLAAEILARRAADRRTVDRWKQRRAAIAARDRRLRRFWLGFGAAIGLALLALLAVAGWVLWHALAGLNLGVLAIPVLLGLAALLTVGGHRCITTVQHWH